MKKRYERAWIVGKFMPLHKGHLALIDFAGRQADRIEVCVLAHAGEPISLEQRVAWVGEQYTNAPSVSVRGYAYDPALLDSSSRSNRKSAREWANHLRRVCPGFGNAGDAIVGSEPYVQYMAEWLGVDAVVYDVDRIEVPVSATEIKKDVLRCWDYLAPAVKRSYVTHICVCGSESTGKSTVCKRLEEAYDFVTMIPEIGRCLVGKSVLCSMTTLRRVYDIHRGLLQAVVDEPPTPIVLWDTDNVTTLSYARFLHHCDLVGPDEEFPRADRYFFFESNIPYQDDATRLDREAALELCAHHQATYARYGIELERVTSGDRCEVVRAYLQERVARLQALFLGYV